MDELLSEVLEILKGIETEELLDDEGWWETSFGAKLRWSELLGVLPETTF